MINEKVLLLEIRNYRKKHLTGIAVNHFVDKVLEFVENRIKALSCSCKDCWHYNNTNCIARCGYCTKFDSAMRDGDGCTEFKARKAEYVKGDEQP